MKKLVLMLSPLALSGILVAQAPPPRSIRASGEGVVSVRPDLARVTVGVSTQAATAQEAAAQNATAAERVINAVRAALGAGGTVETVSYTVTPNYRSSGGESVLIGYTVTNLIEATTFEMGSVGRIIDAATGAGANRVQSLRFGLRDADPPTRQALTAAATQARGRASAIANGLGGRAGAVLSAQEGSVVRPVTDTRLGVSAGAPATPIETGMVEVRATVAVEVEFVPGT